jgi:hypothetical protein
MQLELRRPRARRIPIVPKSAIDRRDHPAAPKRSRPILHIVFAAGPLSPDAARPR